MFHELPGSNDERSEEASSAPRTHTTGRGVRQGSRSMTASRKCTAHTYRRGSPSCLLTCVRPVHASRE
eukprot:4572482-Prymnesium_polylepis.1